MLHAQVILTINYSIIVNTLIERETTKPAEQQLLSRNALCRAPLVIFALFVEVQSAQRFTFEFYLHHVWYSPSWWTLILKKYKQNIAQVSRPAIFRMYSHKGYSARAVRTPKIAELWQQRWDAYVHSLVKL